MHSGGFLVRRLYRLSKTGPPSMKNLIKPLAKSVLIPLGLTAAASVADASMHKKILGSGTTAVTISNDEREDIVKIVKSLEDSSLLLNGGSETIQNHVQ